MVLKLGKNYKLGQVVYFQNTNMKGRLPTQGYKHEVKKKYNPPWKSQTKFFRKVANE